MKEKEINSWQDFIDIVGNHKYREWFYRGQSKSTWKLESTLFRIIERNIKLRSYGKSKKVTLNRELYEKEMVDKFKKTSHLFLEHMPKDDSTYDWLSMMQHYGAPSRMLDFSFSPYVALFFAISGIDTKAAVFCIKYSELQKTDEDNYSDIENLRRDAMEQNKKLKKTILIPFEPQFTNNRLMSQQGAFLIPNTLNFSHNEILDEYENDDFVYKIIIREEIAYQLIEKLAQMNISYTNIYPGLEGFCKSFENIGIIPINRLRPINTKLNA